MSDPDLIKVIVYRAKNLQGKKPGRHKYSVIFGIGPKKYRTDVVRESSGNPEWNEESEIHVPNCLDQVFFIVTEKDDVLGQIQIPVTSLKGVQGKTFHTALQSHKKCHNPQGELVYQCYILQYRPAGLTPLITPSPQGSKSGLGKIRQSLATTPIIPRRFRKKTEKDGERKNSSLSNFNKKLSKSIQDLFHLSKHSNNPNGEDTDGNLNRNSDRRFSLGFASLSSGLDTTGISPVLSRVTPKFGPTDGGTEVIIEGENLGICKADILHLTICGCDCLDTLEYESEHRLSFITRPCKAGIGDLVLETSSGGRLFRKNVFTYQETEEGETSSIKLVITDCDSAVFENGGSFISNNDEDMNGLPKTLPRLRRDNDLPRVKSTDNVSSLGRFKKNFAKHARRASFAAINLLPHANDKEDETDGDFSDKDKKILDLQAENAELREENDKIKKRLEFMEQGNEDMNSYIKKLVSKVLTHCPEVLEMEDEDKTEDTKF